MFVIILHRGSFFIGIGLSGGIISGLNSDWATCIFIIITLEFILVIANPRQGKDFWCPAENSYFIQYECGLLWAKDFKECQWQTIKKYYQHR